MDRFDESEIHAVQEVIRSGELSRFFTDFRGGRYIKAFEEEFANYIGTKYAVTVSNGTVALEVALQAMDIKRGDEVITTPLSFFATGSAILRVGAKPVFVDIQKNTLNIDPKNIRAAITAKTKAIIPVPLNGMPCEIQKIMEIAEENGLLVLEDCAQSLGATINGQKVGSFAHMSTFSFQESKTITTFGEGGMITTDDPTFHDRALNIRNHGNVYGTMTDVVCTNARLTEAAAAFGLMQLLKLDKFNKMQTRNAEYMIKRLPPSFQPVYSYPLPTGIKSVYYLIPLVSSNVVKDIFLQYCKEMGLSKGVPGQNVGYYKRLIYESKLFTKHAQCPNAEWARNNVLLFDIHRWKDLRDFQTQMRLFKRIVRSA